MKTSFSSVEKAPRHQRMALTLVWILLANCAFPTFAQTSSSQKSEGVRNSLGMIFLKVRGSLVMFSMWETRVADWDAYVADTHQSWSHTPSFPQTGTHPVVNVTMSEAAAFAEWLTKKERREGRITERQAYRLPTNLEWDAAVGLTQGQQISSVAKYPWGSEWPPPRQAGNYNSQRIEGGRDDGFEFTAPVGQFRPSEDGLFDLGGNAWEWVCDSRTPDRAINGTLRGGSWLYWRKECLESGYHYSVKADLRSPTVGFRCVLENSAEIEAVRERQLAVEQQERTRLLDRPTATAEEVREAQNRLAVTPDSTLSLASKASTRTGEQAQPSPGHPFINSLAYRLLPMAGARLLLLGESEVRERDYQMFLLANSDPGERGRFSMEGEHAVAQISWEDAVSFCKWLTQKELGDRLLPVGAQYRLPTLAEWRGVADDGRTASESGFPWGATWPPAPEVGNLGVSQVVGGARGRILPVKMFSANKAGFYDLIGNVAEWCADIPPGKDGVRWYCGGSWQTTNAAELRGGAASEAAPNVRLPAVGFRLLLELPWNDKSGPAKSAP